MKHTVTKILLVLVLASCLLFGAVGSVFAEEAQPSELNQLLSDIQDLMTKYGPFALSARAVVNDDAPEESKPTDTDAANASINIRSTPFACEQRRTDRAVELRMIRDKDIAHQLILKRLAQPDIQGAAACHQNIAVLLALFHHLDDALRHRQVHSGEDVAAVEFARDQRNDLRLRKHDTSAVDIAGSCAL